MCRRNWPTYVFRTIGGLIASPPVRPLSRFKRASWVEGFVVALLAFAITLFKEWGIIVHANAINSDAMIHEFWMRRFQDPALFGDRLTDALVDTGYIPPGHQGVLWAASHFLDPVLAAELLPLILVPLSALLVFLIVREHRAWPMAAWIAAILFILPWELHRFTGGHSRAFIQPIVLLLVFFLLRKKDVWAAIVPPLGVLLYPTAGAVAIGIYGLSAFPLQKDHLIDKRRLVLVGISGVCLLLVGLAPRMLQGQALGIITKAEALRYPEFGPTGQIHFFNDDLVTYLKVNFSGFRLHNSGSLLAVGALLLFMLRPANVKLLRREVWMMAIASLGLFILSHLLLFRLYLPQRYTYPLVPFFCIVIALAWKPTFDSLSAFLHRRDRALLWILVPALSLCLAVVAAVLAFRFFPLGDGWSQEELVTQASEGRATLLLALGVGAILTLCLFVGASLRKVAVSTATVAALLGVSLFAGEAAMTGMKPSAGRRCGPPKLMRHLQTTPKDTLVAGSPVGIIACVPISARRPVLISRKLYQPWHKPYFRIIRPRMFDAIRAAYGPSIEDIVKLREKYGVDLFLITDRSYSVGGWRRKQPFTRVVRSLFRTVGVPASLRLPQRCRTFEGEGAAVFDLACVADNGR
jgi:hypothetical protein